MSKYLFKPSKPQFLHIFQEKYTWIWSIYLNFVYNFFLINILIGHKTHKKVLLITTTIIVIKTFTKLKRLPSIFILPPTKPKKVISMVYILCNNYKQHVSHGISCLWSPCSYEKNIVCNSYTQVNKSYLSKKVLYL